jgi:hypothetical protein
MNWWLFKLDECELRLNGNAQVLNKLRSFYNEQLLQETRNLGTEVRWIDGCEDAIVDFVSQLDQVITDLDEVLHKANLIYRQAKNIEHYVGSSSL